MSCVVYGTHLRKVNKLLEKLCPVAPSRRRRAAIGHSSTQEQQGPEKCATRSRPCLNLVVDAFLPVGDEYGDRVSDNLGATFPCTPCRARHRAATRSRVASPLRRTP